MKKTNLIPFRETSIIALGELIVSALIIAVFAIIGKLDYTVLLGALLGSAVIVLNFLFISIGTNNAIDRIMEIRGNAAMSEEEIAAFTKENTAKLQSTVQLSYFIRLISMLAALVLALLTKQFNVIATAIPLFMLRPIIYVSELVRKRPAVEAVAVPTEAEYEEADGEKNEKTVGDHTYVYCDECKSFMGES